VNYNERVPKALLLIALAPLLMGGACEKKTAKAGDDPRPVAIDDQKTPEDQKAIAAVDLSKLDSDKQATFDRLLGSLPSPCGKSESLRKSFTSDRSCKRAPFAVRYVLALLEDEAPAGDIEDFYRKKYQPGDTVKLDVSRAPRIGPEDAPIQLVEFFDYGCPHCVLAKPIFEKVLEDEQGKVIEYFMMFPLDAHSNSKSAAAAALAANAQGKFKEMHDILFDRSPMHTRENVMEYASKIGLDPVKFEKDYNAAFAQVAADQKQGEGVGVNSTPTVFFNGRRYEGPIHKKYIELWVDEELEVNR
jgi:protein-disulfide isomerase